MRHHCWLPYRWRSQRGKWLAKIALLHNSKLFNPRHSPILQRRKWAQNNRWLSREVMLPSAGVLCSKGFYFEGCWAKVLCQISYVFLETEGLVSKHHLDAYSGCNPDYVGLLWGAALLGEEWSLHSMPPTLLERWPGLLHVKHLHIFASGTSWKWNLYICFLPCEVSLHLYVNVM